MKYIYVVSFIFISFMFVFCDKILSIPSNNSFMVKDEIISNDKLLVSYVSSVYDDLYFIFNNQSATAPYANISFIVGAMSDEYINNLDLSNVLVRHAYQNSYYVNELGNIPNFFSPWFKVIVRCNNIIDNFLSNDIRYNNFKNEIRAIRAIIYFYLIQLYEEIPLIVSSDIDDNFYTPRSKKEVIYNFCIKELEDVFDKIEENNLKIDFSETKFSYTERINKNVVAYFLSAFYMLNKEYSNSIKYSLYLKTKFEFNENFYNKFKIDSKENVWILNPSAGTIVNLYNNANASFLNFRLLPAGSPFTAGNRPFSLSDSLVKSMRYNDKRKSNFIDSVFYNNKWRYLPHKYKVIGLYNYNNVTEQFAIVRLPMIYFNLIEAYYLDSKVDSSIYYFNEISSVNYENYSYVENLSLIDIIQERNKELFSELGDRWFTLNRNNILDSIMSIYLPIKNNGRENWNPQVMKYLPIPFNDLLINPNL